MRTSSVPICRRGSASPQLPRPEGAPNCHQRATQRRLFYTKLIKEQRVLSYMGLEPFSAAIPFTSFPLALLQPLWVAQVIGSLSWRVGATNFQPYCNASALALAWCRWAPFSGRASLQPNVSLVGLVRAKLQTCHASVLSAFCSRSHCLSYFWRACAFGMVQRGSM